MTLPTMHTKRVLRVCARCGRYEPPTSRMDSQCRAMWNQHCQYEEPQQHGPRKSVEEHGERRDSIRIHTFLGDRNFRGREGYPHVLRVGCDTRIVGKMMMLAKRLETPLNLPRAKELRQ